MASTVYVPAKPIDFSKSRLLIICASIGQTAQIAGDLLALNHSLIHVGYFASTAISPEVHIDANIVKIGPNPVPILPAEGTSLACNPCVVYYSEALQIAVLILRSRIITGKLDTFEKDVQEWIQTAKFVGVFVAASTLASTVDLRESNSRIPRFMSTHNVAGKTMAEAVNSKAKVIPAAELYHTESDEEDAECLYMAGQAPSLIKVLSKMLIPEYTLLVHAFDGVDLVGGWAMYSKILEIMGIDTPEAIEKKLATLSLGEGGMIPTGKLYSDVMHPEVWKIYMN